VAQYITSVVIYYEVPEEGVERTTGISIESDITPTRELIDAEVQAIAENLVNPRFSPLPGGQAWPVKFHWEVQGVFEYT
jgi:hypothetical protein